MNIKALAAATLLTVAGGLTAFAPAAEANSIIRGHQAAQAALTPEKINRPNNGGTTTLAEKCEAVKYFQRAGNISKSMELGFQMGWEHADAISAFGTGGSCQKVGVYGVL